MSRGAGEPCSQGPVLRPNLQTDLLQTFVAVAESESFTGAGAAVGRTQSAVSLQIQRLETLLDCPLFERTKRRVELTRAGREFLIYARRILRLHDEAVAAVNPALGEAVIRVGMPNDYAELFMPQLLRRFEADYPEVRCDIECDLTWDLLARLDRGALDIVLGIRHAARSTGRTLCHEEIVWVAGPHFEPAAPQGGPVPLVLYPESCPYRARATEALAGAGRPYRVVYTSQSPTGIRIAVEARGAVTVTSRRTVPAHWRILGNADGFPDLPPAELQLFTAGAITHRAVSHFTELIEAELAGSTPTV